MAAIICGQITFAQTADSTISAGSTLNLHQCVDIAIKNNLQVEQSQLTMQSNGIYRNQAIANLLPTLNASGSQGLNYGKSINPTTYAYINQEQGTGNYGLNAGLTLFSGLQLQNAIKQNQYNYDASKLDWQQQKDNITLNVLLAYLQVLSYSDLLAITRQQADVDAQNVARLEIQNREGAIAPSALSDLRGQYAQDQVNITTGIYALEASKVNLFQIMNIPYQRDARYDRIAFDLKIPDFHAGTPDSIYQTALGILPLVKSADLKIKAAEKNVLVYKGQYYPTLSLYGSISSNYSNLATNTILGNVVQQPTGDFVTIGGTNYNVITQQQSQTFSKVPFSDQFNNNRYTQVGLSLQVPILNYLRVRNNVKQAKLTLRNTEFIAANTKLQLQQNVELAYQNLVSADGQLKSYQDQVNAYNESLHSADVKFKAGVITSVDYVIAKNNADRANTNLVAARYNFIFRTKILDYYKGTLTW